ncbi:hypothetical protein HYQ46_007178 [Verticillium longisporum]|nr:hypothetical protein HYQ46_007178 [Verticillium longisporum]
MIFLCQSRGTPRTTPSTKFWLAAEAMVDCSSAKCTTIWLMAPSLRWRSMGSSPSAILRTVSRAAAMALETSGER